MANWQNVQQGLVSGFQVGQATGGKLSGVGMALKKVANSLKERRETGEALETKRNILGMEEASKLRLQGQELEGKEKLLEKEASLSPKEWKPQTQEEALEFESSKAGLKKGLTLSNALGILSDPMKASQIKRTYPNLYKEAENVVKENLGEEVLAGIIPTAKLPGKVKGKLPNKIVPETEDIMDTNW
jgi:hypothetical protein